MTRKQLAAMFSEHLQRKHWKDQERLAKEATPANAKAYSLGWDLATPESKPVVVPVSAMQSNAPTVTPVVKDGEEVGYKVVWK
jgi:hypothetical protein